MHTTRVSCDCYVAFARHDVVALHEPERDGAEAEAALERAVDDVLSSSRRPLVGSVVHMLGERFFGLARAPPALGRLGFLRVLDLSHSNVVCVAPELGAMLGQLEELLVTGCYRLHFLPLELTRCRALRVLRGNPQAFYGYKGGPFPSLPRETCSLQQLCVARLLALGRPVPPLLRDLERQLGECSQCAARAAIRFPRWVRRSLGAASSGSCEVALLTWECHDCLAAQQQAVLA